MSLEPPVWYDTTQVDASTVRITEPFVHPTFSANMWHMRGRDADLLVDTGMGLAPLAPVLDTGGRPLVVVATHIHVDHVGALHEFADRAGPALSAEGFGSMPDALTFADWFRGLDQPVARLPSPDWDAATYSIRPAPLARRLSEGDVVDLGDRRFRVFELPGHSPDSIGLFDEMHGIFFAGDAIYDDELIDDISGSDRAAYRLTMERLKHLPVRIVHGGHGPSFDRARMDKIAEEYLRRDFD